VTWRDVTIVAFGLAAVAYGLLALSVWTNRQAVGAYQLIVMLLSVKVWCICYAVELSSHTLGVAQWWSGLKYIGIVLLPPALWSYVLEYTGRGRLSRRTFALLMIHPVVILTILAVQPWRWLLQAYTTPPVRMFDAPVPSAGSKFFWVHAAYVSALMLSAVFTLLARMAAIAPRYRRAGALLIVASLVPFVGNVLWNGGLVGDIPDPTPLLFLITAVVLVWGFFWMRGLDLTPIAQDMVVEQMAEGMLVLDVYGRVAEVNAAGAAIVGKPRGLMIGRYAVDLLPGLQPVLEKAEVETGDGRVEDELPLPPARDVAVSLTGVTDPMGRRIARLAVLRDVTERNRTERQVRELLDEQTHLSETLRQSLLPASLPEVPGLRLAARSVPSARGGGVGGDFYDVHPVGDAVNAFVLGDVSGKGVHAAVVTSMARYTVRTLSAQGWSPREVLQQLNRALQTPDDVERFCTVLYGQVTSRSQPSTDVTGDLVAGPGPGVRLVITLGGHPPPLLRRRDRSVRPIGVPGTALGLLPAVDVREVAVDLAAGDVLLAYTDGVTEARDGSEEFGEERLATVLSEVPAGLGPDAVDGRPGLADAVADAVLQAVSAFSPERDDVALLVLAAT
jgi:PAS domain S-box-containing protein